MEAYTITIQGTGKTFQCKQNQSVLDAMIRAGSGPFHYGCYGGGCGVCKIRVLEGTYHVIKTMSQAHITPDLEEDTVLACCIRPRGPMTIANIAPVHRPRYPSFH